MAKAPTLPGSVDYHFDKGDSVTLVVGSEKQELLVHANYIARESNFFKTALKKEWREGQTRTIPLPADEYETVTHYLRYLYSEKLPTSGHEGRLDLDPEEDVLFVTLAKLYLFANRVMSDPLRDDVIREIHRLSSDCSYTSHKRCYPNYRSINLLYDGTLESDPVRVLIADLCIYKGHEDRLNPKFDPRFLLDLSKGLLAGIKSDDVSRSRHDLCCRDVFVIEEYLGGPM